MTAEQLAATVRQAFAPTVAPLPREGVDRCPCGAKYWDRDRCHSCGDRYRPEDQP